MRLPFQRSMLVILCIATIAVGLFLFVPRKQPDRLRGQSQQNGPEPAVTNFASGQDDPRTGTISLLSHGTKDKSVSPNLSTDEMLDSIREELYQSFGKPGQPSEVDKRFAKAKNVKATLDGYLAGRVGLFRWIRTASDEERPLILAGLRDGFDSASDPLVRRGCLMGLSQFPQEGLEVLQGALLADPDEGVRQIAAYLLGVYGGEEHISSLFDAVRADQPMLGRGRPVAGAAIQALGAIGGEQAGALLLRIWTDRQLSAGCREGIIVAAGDSGYHGAMGLILDVFAGTDEIIRDNAALALGMLAKANSDRPALVDRAIATVRQGLVDSNPRVRTNAATALGEIGTMDDIPYLEGLLQDTYIVTVTYMHDGEERTKLQYPVRKNARRAIDRIKSHAAESKSEDRVAAEASSHTDSLKTDETNKTKEPWPPSSPPPPPPRPE